MSLRFDEAVPPGGYAWWYVDAWSDDGRQGLTLIAFIGSVFSPYYALARRRGGGRADPEAHCAINLALYGAPGAQAPKAWCMTERGAGQLRREAHRLGIGPSRVSWSPEGLVVDIDEVAVPRMTRLRGQLRLRAPAWREALHALDPAGQHHWRPIAPSARLEVDLAQPGVRWEGAAYFDANAGARPLDRDFQRWDWSRAPLPGGGAAVLYDVTGSDGAERRIALAFDAPGTAAARPIEPPPRHALPPTGWRLPRFAGGDANDPPQVVQTLEDGPFYARSRVRSRIGGVEMVSMHESLSLTRWRRPIVQAMLPFRMPRRG